MEEITALIDRDKKIIMDWSAKTGCTVAVKLFFRHMGLLEDALSYHLWVHEYRMKVFNLQHHIYIEDLKNPEFYKFKIVRNPYARVVSSYIHMMRHPIMQRPLKRKLLTFSADVSFRQFVKFLGKIDLSYWDCDPHYSLQKKFYESEISFDRIIKLENLIPEIDQLNRDKNFNFDLTGLTSDHHINKNDGIKTNISSKKWSEIADNIPNYEFFYTDELIKKVGELYKADIEAYKYTYQDMLDNS